MKLKKDWSLAHFLYYNVWIIIIGLIISFLSINSTYFTGGVSFFINAPYSDPMVQVDSEQFISTDFLVNDEHYLMPLQVKGRFLVNNSDNSFESKNLLLIAIRFLKMIILVAFFYLLSRILKSVTNDNPFNPLNSRRLIAMGGLLVVQALVAFGHAFFVVHIFSTLQIEPALDFKPDFESVNSVFFGLLIMLLGFIFREATKIHEEQKLTV